MSFTSRLRAAVISAVIALPVLSAVAMASDGLMVRDAYARSSNPKAGAAFMMIHNHTDTDDRLVGVASDRARLVQLHTHLEDENGIMKMMHVEEGFALPAGGMIMLERGGNHVMLMGLTAPFEDGETVPITLTFERAGDMTINVVVDQARKPGDGKAHEHGTN